MHLVIVNYAKENLMWVLQCYNKIWDIHPMIPLIKNAGGYISTWKGKDARIGGSIVASSSNILHKKILNMLKPVA